jgi:1-deoxy-D-xylulose-5-phosphate reductoisomerase
MLQTLTAPKYRPADVDAPRRVSILGSTGSIGCSTVDLIAREPERYRVEALTAQENVDKLIMQATLLRPRLAVIGNPAHYAKLKEALLPIGIDVASGEAGLIEAAKRPADWLMAAIVGVAGLRPTLAAIERGATVALANKESLVCAGELVMQSCNRSGATLLPVDSEHNAIFQVFDSLQSEQVEKVTLTASGGPFRTRPIDQMASITPEEAVRHPNWDMGAKISVDSATMMNKGLELIEAYHLFPLTVDQLDVLVHPQSIVHSLVHYQDGSVLAQLGLPDMRIPIAYTLSWPERMHAPTPRLNLAEIGKLEFELPDDQRFPALKLARDALKAGSCATAALNAANEIAVARFLKREILFTDIAILVEHVLEQIATRPISSLDDAMACDAEARQFAMEYKGS